jgi:hypothetical protein
MPVNFVYGCTVLRKWKSGNSIDFLRQLSCDTYYPTTSEEEKKDVAVKKQQDRLDFEAPDGEDQEISMSKIMDVVMAIWQNTSSRRPKDDSRKRVQLTFRTGCIRSDASTVFPCNFRAKKEKL